MIALLILGAAMLFAILRAYGRRPMGTTAARARNLATVAGASFEAVQLPDGRYVVRERDPPSLAWSTGARVE